MLNAVKMGSVVQLASTESRKNVPRHIDRLWCRSDSFGLASFVASNELNVEIGDLVQVDRVLYTEWVLYVGDGNVVHICDIDSENEIPRSDFASVKVTSLSDVAGANSVRVNNKIVGAKERNLTSFATEQVLQNAYNLLDQVVEFNMLTRNSEHYVTEWKYGLGWSDQAEITMNVMKTLSASDSIVGHNVLVNSLNAVLNSPGSPISNSPPKFINSGGHDKKKDAEE